MYDASGGHSLPGTPVTVTYILDGMQKAEAFLCMEGAFYGGGDMNQEIVGGFTCNKNKRHVLTVPYEEWSSHTGRAHFPM